jgi:SAM-dependent methyltransferase
MSPVSDDRGVPSLADAWESEAAAWVVWARAPGHDSYWRFHRDAFLAILPPPGRLTLDIGCGEGRLARDLSARGHGVVALDRSPAMARHAAAAGGTVGVLVADAARLPFPDAAADLVVAFMSLHDMDDMTAAVREVARVLEPGGRLCLAVVHPINSGGGFAGPDPDAAYVLAPGYFATRRYRDDVEQDGLRMTFESLHHPLEAYFAALEAAGLLTESVREPRPARPDAGARSSRIPLFLHVRARRP